MRILFIAKYSPKSSRLWGGEIHIIKLAEELAKKNVKIFFINSDYTGIINCVQYIKLPYKKYRKTPYNAEFNHLIRIIKKLKIDIINKLTMEVKDTDESAVIGEIINLTQQIIKKSRVKFESL